MTNKQQSRIIYDFVCCLLTESESTPLEYMDNALTISLGETITGQLGGFDNQDFYKFTLLRSSTIKSIIQRIWNIIIM